MWHHCGNNGRYARTERLTSSYGISLFVNGILQLVGPPLCGLWFESRLIRTAPYFIHSVLYFLLEQVFELYAIH
ncbi:hypothetical protein CVS40_9293 [Lucilia cuprina]|nr:hypothetical protein CVS40_9293 [Lucilia cuprina]